MFIIYRYGPASLFNTKGPAAAIYGLDYYIFSEAVTISSLMAMLLRFRCCGLTYDDDFANIFHLRMMHLCYFDDITILYGYFSFLIFIDFEKFLASKCLR